VRTGRGSIALSVAAMLLMAGCGTDTESTGLPLASSSPTDEPQEPQETSTEESDGGAEPSPDTEPSPSPTFTQPHLPPDDPSVINVPTQLPVEGPDRDVTDEEAAVLADFGSFMASWDAVLFGVPLEETNLAATATGSQYKTLEGYARESEETQRVTVGSSTQIRVLDVEVDGEQAGVDACLTTPDWVVITGGAAVPEDTLTRMSVTLNLDDGTWKAAEANERNVDTCR